MPVQASFKRIPIEQEERLVNYMVQHDRFASHKVNGCRGVEQRGEQWKRLTSILKDLGLPKTPEGWKTYYKDLKAAARKYKARKIQIFKSTGNQTQNVLERDEIYEKLIRDVMGEENQNGQSIIPEVGVKWIPNEECSRPSPSTYHPIFSSVMMPRNRIHQNYNVTQNIQIDSEYGDYAGVFARVETPYYENCTYSADSSGTANDYTTENFQDDYVYDDYGVFGGEQSGNEDFMDTAHLSESIKKSIQGNGLDDFFSIKGKINDSIELIEDYIAETENTKWGKDYYNILINTVKLIRDRT